MWFMVWFILPLICLAMVATVLLYQQQRRVAPTGGVLALTAIRLTLLMLLSVLLFGPGLSWRLTHTRNGTLWMVVDQSPSMAVIDAQATPVERLRWAEGLGLLTPRDDSPDRLRARIQVLAGELAALVRESPVRDDRAAVTTFAGRVADWAADLRALQQAIQKQEGAFNTGGDSAGTAARRAMERAAAMVDSNLSAVRGASRMNDALRALNTEGLQQNLREAQGVLAAAAQAIDARITSDRAADTVYRNADAHVGGFTRKDLAHGLLTDANAPASDILTQLARTYHLRIVGFSDNTQSAGTVDPGSLSGTLQSALTPSGQSTNLASALQYVAEQISDDAAAVVIVSDGRHNTPGDPAATARNLASREVRVFGLLVGSHEVSPDAAVELPVFPDWIYVGDTVRPRATIRLDGLTGREAVVELRRGGELLQRQTMRAMSNQEQRAFEFSDTPPQSATAMEYEIRVSQMPGEVNTQNNVASFRIAVKKEQLQALLIEDRPRWEFRYLQAYLSRRQGLKCQSVLLSPAVVTGVLAPTPVMASPDNPRVEAQILPQTLEDWQKFDLIVLGDVDPQTITPQMQQYLAATVRDKGATLITIAGRRAMPEAFAGAPLAEILPVSLNPQWTGEQIARHTRAGFRPGAAPLAAGSVLVRLEGDGQSNTQVWENMSPWYWHSPYTQVKPAATPVWTILEMDPRSARAAPGTIAQATSHALISHLTIGLGRTLHLASDQTWRLRQVGGSNLHDRFWGQAINWAVGSDLPAGGKYVRFGSAQPTYDQSQPVVITARVLRDDLTPYTGLSFAAEARLVQPGGAPAPQAAHGYFQPMDSPGYYQATLTGLPAGEVEVALRGAEVERLLNSDPTATLKTLLIRIMPSMNAERRNMNTDPRRLSEIAAAGRGFAVDAHHAGLLLSRLPRIERKEVTEVQLGFFRDPKARQTWIVHGLFLSLFVLLITFEWVLRKRIGLV